MVIAVANQKGGVGKTTICMHFANYLATKGANVLVVDVDTQKSIVLQRNKDLETFTDQTPLYEVESISIGSVDDTTNFMQKIKKLDGIILLDTPGNVSEDGLIPIFANADIIICPYKYESLCLESTGIFLRVIQKLKKLIHTMNPQMFFVPNIVDKRIGTDEEKQMWEETDNIFKEFGLVTPEINYRSELMRTNTLFINSAQTKEVKKTFDYIIKEGNVL